MIRCRAASAKPPFAVLLLLAIVAIWPRVVYAVDIDAAELERRLALERRVAEIDRALFAELVRLATFNVHFHLEANRHQKWRDITYPIARESGTALGFAATLIDTRQQVKGLDKPSDASREALRKAVTCAIVGNAISGGASALELAQNTWMELKARREAYSPGRSLAFVKSIVANTNRLLDARAQLADEVLLPERRRVIQLETHLIRRIRQQLLFEFGTWSCHSRDLAWRENTFYTIDSLQNFTRMCAAIITMNAFGNLKLGRSATVCALVGNSAATINPILRNFVGIAVRKHQERKLAREIPFERTGESPELDDLQQKLTTEVAESWLRKVAALSYRTEKIDAELDREVKEIERYRQVAQQQSVSGPLIGLTGVASSTLATVAVYDYLQEPKTAIRLGLAGRITQGTGQALALMITPYTTIKGIISQHRLKKRGELPSQILSERLKRIELLEREQSRN
ncbi:MAG TPA: hypothetical protein V6D17_15495 [Candidatus Obscuribacterales bacterium]